MTQKYLKLALLSIFAVAIIFTFQTTQAQTVDQLIFPIAELGDCANAKACKTYCNDLERIQACVDYGVEQGLITEEEAENALKIKSIKEGPGGCDTKDECKTYCTDPTHTEECVTFAQEHNLLKADKIQRYRKFHEALRKGITPGDCHDQHTCETFCFQRSNNERCLKFAEEHGLIDVDHKEMLQSFLDAVEAGTTPGGCKTKEVCREYCAAEEHRTECAEFGQRLGILTRADADKLKRGFEGPGGCKTKEECIEFCNKADHQQTCLEFGRRFKILDSEQIDRIKNVVNEIRETNSQMPEGLESCLKQALSTDIFNKMKAGEFIPDAAGAASIRACKLRYLEEVHDESVEEDELSPAAVQNPPTIGECMIRLYGEEVAAQIKAGTYRLTEEMKHRILVCAEGE